MKSKVKLIKQTLLVFALMVGAISLFSVVIPSVSAAALDSSQSVSAVDDGALRQASILSPGDNPSEIAAATGGETSFRSLLLRIVNYFLTFLGILAVIMVIYGGVTYVTSAGNDESVGNAKKIIMYALVGIIVILLSFVIVNAILGAGTAGGAAGV